jgi:putative DNA primase/helicase
LTAEQYAALEGIAAAADFFDGHTFVAPRMAEWLRSQWPTATGGRQLYAFRSGAYVLAEDFLRGEITKRLGEQWKARRSDEVIAYLTQSSRPLWETPPLDRIAVENGILSIGDRKLTAAPPEFLSPVRIRAAYDPAAHCGAVERFLAQIFPDGADLLYEIVGHLMVPEQRQRAFLLIGGGGNGKSTVLRLITAFLGRENVSAVALHALEENRFATADLYGKLANVFADLDARALTSTGVFKSITDGDPIRAEHKHRAAFFFIPYARLVFSANEPPPTVDSSTAFFDRWVTLPFEARIRGSQQERQQDELLAELTAPNELSGLLNHALDGLDRLNRTHSFTATAGTSRASEAFRVSADSVAGFLADQSQTDAEARTTRAALWHAYRDWCAENNRRALSSQRLHRRVRELVPSLDEVTVKGSPTYIGIQLTENA